MYTYIYVYICNTYAYQHTHAYTTHPYILYKYNPPNRETPIFQYKFKLNQNLNLNLYREIWVAQFVGFRGYSIFSGKCHVCINMKPDDTALKSRYICKWMYTCMYNTYVYNNTIHIHMNMRPWWHSSEITSK